MTNGQLGNVEMRSWNVVDHSGGPGPDILLLHGLMGRGRTWSRQLPWLAKLGRVLTYDAAGHRGVAERGERWTEQDIATERFVADAAAVLRAHARGPAFVIGHSMGGLHAWCLAAAHPELVRGIVVEDMAPDFRGRTLGEWEPWLKSWPVEFATADDVDALVGPIAGRYFREAFDELPGGGYRLHGQIDRWCATAELWGHRDFWPEWAAVQAPSLLIEAKRGITPQGQMSEMMTRGERCSHVVLDTAHLIHDEDRSEFAKLVSRFIKVQSRCSSRH